MRERQKVVLYGNSLVLAGMKTSLAAYPSFDVITLDISPSLTVHDLCALQASVVIFDLATVPLEFPLALLNAQPHLALIGLDAAGDRLLLFSGQQARKLTTGQLVQMIETLPR
jgi:hypothetical protein